MGAGAGVELGAGAGAALCVCIALGPDGSADVVPSKPNVAESAESKCCGRRDVLLEYPDGRRGKALFNLGGSMDPGWRYPGDVSSQSYTFRRAAEEDSCSDRW